MVVTWQKRCKTSPKKPVNAPVEETQTLPPAYVSVDALLAGNGHKKPIKCRSLECDDELSSGSDIDEDEEEHLWQRSVMVATIEGALPKLSEDVKSRGAAIKKKFHKVPVVVPDGDHVEFLTDDLTAVAVDVAVVGKKRPQSKESKLRTNGKCDEDVWTDEVPMIAETIADAAMEHQEGDVGNYGSSITRQRRHRGRGDKMGNRGRNRVYSPYGGGGGSNAQAVAAAAAAGEYEYDGASRVTLKGHNTHSKVFQQPRQRRRPIEGKEVVVAAIDKAPSHGRHRAVTWSGLESWVCCLLEIPATDHLN